MKRLFHLFLAVCLLATPCLGAENTNKLVVVLTPGWPSEAADKIVGEIAHWLLQKAKPGDGLLVFDADEVKLLSDIVVPPGTPRTRATTLRSMESIRTVLGRRPPMPGTPESGQARMSTVVDELAQRMGGKGVWSMVLVANPLFHSRFPAELPYSMAGNLTPNDAQITCSRAEGLFGTKDRRDILKGCVVYWITPSNWAVSTDHERNRVRRFWGLWFQELGAPLWGFSTSAHELFDHAAMRSPAKAEFLQPPLDRKLTRLGMVGPMVIVPGAIDAETNRFSTPPSDRRTLPTETPSPSQGPASGATNSPSNDGQRTALQRQDTAAKSGETADTAQLPEHRGTNSIGIQPVVAPLDPPIPAPVPPTRPQLASIVVERPTPNRERLVVTVIWNGGEQQELDIWWRQGEGAPTMNPSAGISSRVQDPLPAIPEVLRSQGLLMAEMAEVDCRRGAPKQLWIALTSNPRHEALPCAVFVWFKDRFALHRLLFEGSTTNGSPPPTGLATNPAWLQVPLGELFG